MVKVNNRPGKGATRSGNSQLRHRKRIHAQRSGKIFKQHVTDTVVQQAWDNKRNTKDNMNALGLTAIVNTEVNQKNNEIIQIHSENTEVVEKLEKRAAIGEKERPLFMPEGEQKVIQKLMEKYGKNYKQMERDIKLNSMQHTAKQLERKCVRYENETKS
mmetsp:Transcript_7015/g.12568  ORF Transcript_7015/g.12568 Transcript_7015/m.12568 type:complete len:159 (-) Transcript_7015:428-904(-)